MTTSLNARAAATITRHTNGDARRLLDMLGLVDDHGRLLPDDLRVYDIEGAQPVKTKPGAALDGPDHPETYTSPPALRHLPPPEPKPPAQRKAAAKRTPKPRPVADCGSQSGYRRHQKLREPICGPCRDAYNDKHREYEKARRERRKEQSAAARVARKLSGPAGRKLAADQRSEDEAVARCAARDIGLLVAEYQRLVAAGVNREAASVLAERRAS